MWQLYYTWSSLLIQVRQVAVAETSIRLRSNAFKQASNWLKTEELIVLDNITLHCVCIHFGPSPVIRHTYFVVTKTSIRLRLHALKQASKWLKSSLQYITCVPMHSNKLKSDWRALYNTLHYVCMHSNKLRTDWRAHYNTYHFVPIHSNKLKTDWRAH